MIAAMEEFTLSGYRGASVDRIAARAGVSKGAVFYYFKSKYELARETLFYFKDQGQKMLSNAIGNIQKPEDKLKALIEKAVEAGSSSAGRTIGYLFFEVYSEGVIDEDDKEKWNAILEDYTHFVTEILSDAGVKKPQIKAHLILSLMNAIGLQVALFGEEFIPDKKELVEEIYGVFLKNNAGDENGRK